jgi:hypothetical protein
VHYHFTHRVDSQEIEKVGQSQKSHKLASDCTSVPETDVAGKAKINEGFHLVVNGSFSILLVFRVEILPAEYLTLQLLDHDLQSLATIFVHFLWTFLEVIDKRVFLFLLFFLKVVDRQGLVRNVEAFELLDIVTDVVMSQQYVSVLVVKNK